jgi:sec-independent protein translocase protein TatB
MFDIAPSEFMLFAFVALVVIGPKDLPKAMRVVGKFVAQARGVAKHFRSGFDAMIREAELEEMEKKWKEENARIMRDHAAIAEDVTALPPPEVTPDTKPDAPEPSPTVAASDANKPA